MRSVTVLRQPFNSAATAEVPHPSKGSAWLGQLWRAVSTIRRMVPAVGALKDPARHLFALNFIVYINAVKRTAKNSWAGQ